MTDAEKLRDTRQAHEKHCKPYPNALCSGCFLLGLADALAGENAALREALRREDPRNASELFEMIASDFRIATGHMAPGKDRSPYDNDDGTPREDVLHQWREFVNRWHEAHFDIALNTPATDSALRAVRDEALEKAARQTDEHAGAWHAANPGQALRNAAAAIRALKGKL